MKPSLKDRLGTGDFVLAPGVYDAMSAYVAELAGFSALYVSGASLSYTQLGRPDYALTTATELAMSVSRITDRVTVPVIVDADTGFGNDTNVRRTIIDLEKAGAAMIQIEDQTFPKKCGQLSGKSVIPLPEMCDKLNAALDARRSENTLIMGRTDAASVLGLDAALERAQAYIECGVDAVFIEALRTDDAIKRAVTRFGGKVPLLANVVEGGHNTLTRADQLKDAGFQIVIFAAGSSRFVAKQLAHFYGTLYRTGSTDALFKEMHSFDELFGLLDR
ncbi:MAG: oxaloacetate decarboxylase [Rhodoferax sp.]|nr:oxaloacetate decarboxylase [Rhodoferax sp.]